MLADEIVIPEGARNPSIVTVIHVWAANPDMSERFEESARDKLGFVRAIQRIA